MTGHRREAGSALLVVIAVIAVLAGSALAILSQARAVRAASADRVAQAAARHLAEAGVMRGAYALLAGAGARAGSARWDIDGREVQVTIQDEAGRVDLNAGTPLLIGAVLVAGGADVTEAEALTARIVAWRTAAGRRLLPRGPNGGDRPFAAVEELLELDGFRPELFAACAGGFTVFSGTTGIDPALATAPVQAALRLLQDQGVEPPGLQVGSPNLAFTISARVEIDGTVGRRSALMLVTGGSPGYRFAEWR